METLLKGENPREGIRKANASVRSRDWMRFDSLSVPVEGGASTLKNRRADTWRISEKAFPEARKMDATLATRYGSTPYYRLLDHLISMRDILGEREMAEEVCQEAFRRVEEILGLDRNDLLESTKGFSQARVHNAKNDTGILELLFCKGPEAIFELIPTLNIND